jgi:hypothetical protein
LVSVKIEIKNIPPAALEHLFRIVGDIALREPQSKIYIEKTGEQCD